MGFIVKGEKIERSEQYVRQGISVSRSRSRSVSVERVHEKNSNGNKFVRTTGINTTYAPNSRDRSRSVEQRDATSKTVHVGLSSPRSRSTSKTRSRSQSGDYDSRRPRTADKYDSSFQKQRPLSLKEKIRAARRKGLSGDVQDVQYLVEEGPLSFRSLGFVGGFFMILATALDILENMESNLETAASMFLFITGFVIVQLEARPFYMQSALIYRSICRVFSSLRYVWGRGFLYLVSGTIQLLLFSKWCMASGIYFIILGIFSVAFGYRASLKLCALRNSIGTKDEIKFMFHSFDSNRDGYLDMEEFRAMLRAMDQNLNHNDFVAAIAAIDLDNKQKISYDDLETWWEGYNENELPIGAGCLSFHTRDSSFNRRAHLMA